MAFSLAGKTALVTGSSTGLGKGIAKVLGEAGANIGVNYFNNTARADDAIAELEAAGIQAVLAKGDVSDEAGVDAVCSSIEEKFGGIDIVVINATPDQPQLPIEEYDWEFYQ